MSTTCAIATNTGMYGLGIRMSFYILWGTIVLADCVFTPSRSVVERGAASLLEWSVFIALVKLSGDDNGIGAAEAHICSLLVTCTLVFHVPGTAWRFLCGFRNEFDLSLGSTWRSWSSPARNVMTAVRFVFLLVVCAYEFWFWSGGMEALDRGREQCRSYGYLFGRLSLDGDSALRTVSVTFYALLLVGALATAGVVLASSERERRETRQAWREKVDKDFSDDVAFLHGIRAGLHLLVVGLTIAAIEKTILYNEIADACTINSAAELFPLILSICLALRVPCCWYVRRLKEIGEDSVVSDCSTCRERFHPPAPIIIPQP